MKLTPEQIAEKLAEIEAEKQEHERFRQANPTLGEQATGQFVADLRALIERIEQREQQTDPKQGEG